MNLHAKLNRIEINLDGHNKKNYSKSNYTKMIKVIMTKSYILTEILGAIIKGSN